MAKPPELILDIDKDVALSSRNGRLYREAVNSSSLGIRRSTDTRFLQDLCTFGRENPSIYAIYDGQLEGR